MKNSDRYINGGTERFGFHVDAKPKGGRWIIYPRSGYMCSGTGLAAHVTAHMCEDFGAPGPSYMNGADINALGESLFGGQGK